MASSKNSSSLVSTIDARARYVLTGKGLDIGLVESYSKKTSLLAEVSSETSPMELSVTTCNGRARFLGNVKSNRARSRSLFEYKTCAGTRMADESLALSES
jgi:16S rRNA G527 N7-methylase RsmG